MGVYRGVVYVRDGSAMYIPRVSSEPNHADNSTFESLILKHLIKFLYIENQETTRKSDTKRYFTVVPEMLRTNPGNNKPSNASPLAHK